MVIEPEFEPAGVYVVISGSFELTVPATAADDAVSQSRRLGPGDCFGLSFDGQPPAAPGRVRDGEDSTAYFIDKGDLKRLAMVAALVERQRQKLARTQAEGA